MIQFIFLLVLGAIVLFFLIEGYYLRRDVEDDFRDPFEEENKKDDSSSGDGE